MYAAIALRLLSEDIYGEQQASANPEGKYGTFLKAETDTIVTLLKAVVY